MNRSQIIRDNASEAILEEMDILIELSKDEGWEEAYDTESAFEEIEDRIESWGWANKKLRLIDCLKVRIALGQYEPISEEEARQACREGIGLTMRSFPKYKGQRYNYVGRRLIA